MNISYEFNEVSRKGLKSACNLAIEKHSNRLPGIKNSYSLPIMSVISLENSQSPKIGNTGVAGIGGLDLVVTDITCPLPDQHRLILIASNHTADIHGSQFLLVH